LDIETRTGLIEISKVSAATFSIDVGGAKTTALHYAAASPVARLVLAHGAGAPQTHPWMVAMARKLSSHGTRGIDVVTFNFLYAEARRRAPDRKDILEATWRAALDAVRALPAAPRRLFIGGKSMGGRIATQVAATGGAGNVAGLVLLGYPLHPPGKPDRLRAAHLPYVRVPMLFVQGSRDAFGTPAELAPHVAKLSPGTRVFVIEGGDHSLAPPKRKGGETLDQVLERVADEIARFTS
jgi:predicted alpha/beta-hydrolase family hydrolase